MFLRSQSFKLLAAYTNNTLTIIGQLTLNALMQAKQVLTEPKL